MGGLAPRAKITPPMPYVAKYNELAVEISAGLNAVYGGQQPARTALAEVT